jgi:hypothetical protein
MNKFQKLGLIDYNGHMEVHNSLLNATPKNAAALAGVSLTFPVLRLKNEILSDMPAGAVLANVKA